MMKSEKNNGNNSGVRMQCIIEKDFLLGRDIIFFRK